MKKYDYVIIGGGLGGLTVASLLAKSGKSVCVIEGNKSLGGYAHTLKKGKYSFCHEVQYLMGCQPGGPMNRFFKQLGLAKEIKFNELNQKTFDLVSFNNLKVGIPHGLGNFEKEIIRLYAKHAPQIKKYFYVIETIFKTAGAYEKILETSDVLLRPIKHRLIIKYKDYTLHDFFEELKLPQELRAILAGQAGNLCASPKQVSLLMHSAMQVAYCKSAHFPKKGMEFVVKKIAEKITEHQGNKIITACLVKKINCHKDRVISVATEKGTIFGDCFISNIDPKQTYRLIADQRLSSRLHKKLHYNYTNSVFTIYLGLKNVNLKKYGFGKKNIWHHSTFDIDQEFKDEIKKDDFSHPWLFISTPSMLTDKNIVCPPGHQTMEILTFVDYDYFKTLYSHNKKRFQYLKNHIYNHILDIIDEHYLPNIRKYIDEKIIHTPLDIEKLLHSPKGNVYGCSVTPDNYNLGRINSNTYFENMHFVGATSSYPGVMGVTLGGMDLYKKLNS